MSLFLLRILFVLFLLNKHTINRSHMSRFASVHPQIFCPKPLVRILITLVLNFLENSDFAGTEYGNVRFSFPV